MRTLLKVIYDGGRKETNGISEAEGGVLSEMKALCECWKFLFGFMNNYECRSRGWPSNESCLSNFRRIHLWKWLWINVKNPCWLTRIFGPLSFLNSCVNPVALYCVSGVFRAHFNRYLLCREPQWPRNTFSGNCETSFNSTIRRHTQVIVACLFKVSWVDYGKRKYKFASTPHKRIRGASK